MGKTEIILTIIILLLIIFGFWFIFSGEIWYFVAFLENTLYPTFDAHNARLISCFTYRICQVPACRTAA